MTEQGSRKHVVLEDTRRQGVPVILVGWSNTSRIGRTVREALDRCG